MLIETSLLPWYPATEHLGQLMAPSGWGPQGRALTRYLLDRSDGKGRDWGRAEGTGWGGLYLVRKPVSALQPPSWVGGPGQQSPSS